MDSRGVSSRVEQGIWLEETGAFAGVTFSEVRIISFSFVISANGKSLILVDPPLGKERVHKALRRVGVGDSGGEEEVKGHD